MVLRRLEDGGLVISEMELDRGDRWVVVVEQSTGDAV
jgi:hypothetical protein